jgi:hypothetical protein
MNICNLVKIICIILSNFVYLYPDNNNQSDITVSGVIRDANTSEPISYVNVFLANTTIGAASDQLGNFKILNVPEGIHDLIFDRVGYEVKSIQLRIIGAETHFYTIKLYPKIYSTEKIQIIADKPEKWMNDLDVFIREFIGQTKNANECIILNPEVLYFQIDSIANNLIAFSDSTIKVINHALGYKIFVKLIDFKYNIKDGSILYEMYPKFEELIPQEEEKMIRWIKNRQKVYKGSLRQFLSLLTYGEYFPSFKSYIIMTQAGYKVNVGEDFFNCRKLINSNLIKITFDDFVGVDYYLFGYPNKSSMLRLDQGYALIDTLGNIYGPITKRGSWSEERLADLLPYDYEFRK